MASSGVNVKMGVSGISQFKQGIRDAQSAVKTLDAQLKLNEAQYKATGDAETYMSEKTTLLQQKMEQQQRVVQQMEQALKAMSDNGVSKTSAAFQQMQTNLVRAQTDLVNIQNQLNGVETAGDGASNEISEMNSQLKNVTTQVSFESIKSGIDGITSKLEAAASAALTLGMRLVNLTLDAAGWADELATDAEVYGMSTEELQRAQKTSKRIDTSVEAIVGAKKRLKKGLGEDSEGVMGAFAAFGLDPNSFETLDDKFWAIGDAIYHMSDAEEQEAYAQKVFGRSWDDLRPLFAAGRQEYEETNAKWSVVSDENLEKLTKLDDAYQTLSEEWQALTTTLLSALGEALTPVMEKLTALLKEFNDYLDSPEGKEMLQALADAIGGLFEGLADISVQDIVDKFQEVLNGIVDGLKWIYENKEGIVNAIKAVLAVWGTFTVTSGITSLLQLFTGIRTFASGGGGGAGGPGVVATPTGGTGGAGGAGGAAGASIFSKFAYGLSNAWSLGGGASVFGPIAALAAAGYAGFKMIESNLNDPRYNNIYGEDGVGGILDTMSEEQWKLALEYKRLYETEYGSEAAQEARTKLYESFDDKLLSQEFAVEYIEDILDAHERGWDEMYDGAYARMEQVAEQMGGGTTNQNSLTSSDIATFTGLPALIAQAVENANIRVYIDGELAGAAVGPYVNTYLGMSMTNMVR